MPREERRGTAALCWHARSYVSIELIIASHTPLGHRLAGSGVSVVALDLRAIRTSEQSACCATKLHAEGQIMTTGNAALEARVSNLETQVRVISPKLDALTYLISQVHEETRAIRAEQASQTEKLAGHDEKLARLDEKLAIHTKILARHDEKFARQNQILAEQGLVLAYQSERLIRLNEKLASHTEILDRHTETLGRNTETLDRHTEILDRHTETLGRNTQSLGRQTEMLEQILQRLPDSR
jgi:chromosome segregation ATPase